MKAKCWRNLWMWAAGVLPLARVYQATLGRPVRPVLLQPGYCKEWNDFWSESKRTHLRKESSDTSLVAAHCWEGIQLEFPSSALQCHAASQGRMSPTGVFRWHKNTCQQVEPGAIRYHCPLCIQIQIIGGCFGVQSEESNPWRYASSKLLPTHPPTDSAVSSNWRSKQLVHLRSH